MNSREKGKRGERQWRDVLRAEGFHARRGQQFAGGADSPDVVCEELSGFHFEVKAVERLNIEDAMGQARRDAGRKLPIVVHRRSHRRWLVTMEAETFFILLRGGCDSLAPARSALDGPSPAGNSFSRLPGDSRLRDDLPNETEGHGAPRSDRCRQDKNAACTKEQEAQGTGEPRSDRCRGGTGHGGGDGAGGCWQGTEQGSNLEPKSKPTVSRGEAVAAGRGRAGDTGGDQEGRKSAADGGPQRSRCLAKAPATAGPTAGEHAKEKNT